MMQTDPREKNLIDRETGSFSILWPVLLLTGSGFLSAYLYCLYKEQGAFLLPGILYTTVTLVIFNYFRKTPVRKNLLIYFTLMLLTYLLMWVLTLMSSWFAMIGGILTAGTGAVLTFELANRYITSFKFSKETIFWLGGLAFGVTDVLGFVLEKAPMEYILGTNDNQNAVFADVFIFWHLVVGITLFLRLRRERVA